MDTFLIPGTVQIRPPRYEDERQQPYDPERVEAILWPAEGDSEDTQAFIYGPDPEIVRVDRGDYMISFEPTSPGVWHLRVDTERGAWTTYFYAKPAQSPV